MLQKDPTNRIPYNEILSHPAIQQTRNTTLTFSDVAMRYYSQYNQASDFKIDDDDYDYDSD